MYQVQYQDGSTVDIPLVNGENIRDWTAAARGLSPRERARRAASPGRARTKAFPVVCVFQMLWVNPKPDVAVKAVRFSNPSKACPVLIAVTAVVGGKTGRAGRRGAGGRVASPRPCWPCATATTPRRRVCSRRPWRPTPSHAGACQALAQLYDKLKNEDAAFEAYKAWAATGSADPAALQPHRASLRGPQTVQAGPGGLHAVAANRVEPTAHHRGEGPHGKTVERLTVRGSKPMVMRTAMRRSTLFLLGAWLLVPTVLAGESPDASP